MKWDIVGGDKKDYESKTLEGVNHLSHIIMSARIFCTNDTHGDYCNQTIAGTCFGRGKPLHVSLYVANLVITKHLLEHV